MGLYNEGQLHLQNAKLLSQLGQFVGISSFSSEIRLDSTTRKTAGMMSPGLIDDNSVIFADTFFSNIIHIVQSCTAQQLSQLVVLVLDWQSGLQHPYGQLSNQLIRV